MRPRAFSASGVFILFVVTPAIADWTMDFVRITCIPEARYFRLDYAPVYGPSVFRESESNDEERAKRLLPWKKAGYYEVANLNYECTMPEATYKLTVRQPPAHAEGTCGLEPVITLNLFRDDRPVLYNVTFGNDCFGGPSVVGAEIFDGYQGSRPSDMTLCVTPKYDAPQKCKSFSNTFGRIPIVTEQKVDEYSEISD